MWNKVVPKCFPYLEDSVDSDTINFVVRYEPLDPSDEHIENNWIVLLSQVRQSFKLALLEHSLVVAVLVAPVDGTTVVLMGGTVEGVHFRGWVILPGVVHNNVHHKPHVTFLQGRTESWKFVDCPVFFVQSVEVLGPLAVLAVIEVENDGRDPDRVEPHAWDLVQLTSESSKCASTIGLKVRTGRIRFWRVWWLKSVH